MKTQPTNSNQSQGNLQPKELRAIVKEKDVAELLIGVKRTLQVDRVAKDEILTYLFDGKREEREEITLKDL